MWCTLWIGWIWGLLPLSRSYGFLFSILFSRSYSWNTSQFDLMYCWSISWNFLSVATILDRSKIACRSSFCMCAHIGFSELEVTMAGQLHAFLEMQQESHCINSLGKEIKYSLVPFRIVQPPWTGDQHKQHCPTQAALNYRQTGAAESTTLSQLHQDELKPVACWFLIMLLNMK